MPELSIGTIRTNLTEFSSLTQLAHDISHLLLGLLPPSPLEALDVEYLQTEETSQIAVYTAYQGYASLEGLARAAQTATAIFQRYDPSIAIAGISRRQADNSIVLHQATLTLSIRFAPLDATQQDDEEPIDSEAPRSILRQLTEDWADPVNGRSVPVPLRRIVAIETEGEWVAYRLRDWRVPDPVSLHAAVRNRHIVTPNMTVDLVFGSHMPDIDPSVRYKAEFEV